MAMEEDKIEVGHVIQFFIKGLQDDEQIKSAGVKVLSCVANLFFGKAYAYLKSGDCDEFATLQQDVKNLLSQPGVKEMAQQYVTQIGGYAAKNWTIFWEK